MPKRPTSTVAPEKPRRRRPVHGAGPPRTDRGTFRERIAAVQRLRALDAALEVLCANGYRRAMVTEVINVAGMARGTFYEAYEDLDHCIEDFLDIFEADVVARFQEARLQQLPWRERMSRGLELALEHADRQPQLARVCIVESALAGPGVAARRASVQRRACQAIREGGQEGEVLAEAVLGGILAVIGDRMLAAPEEPLLPLCRELSAFIALAYAGPEEAARERALPPPKAAGLSGGGPGGVQAPPQGPQRLTYRTARVLAAVAERPGASNREVASAAGISDEAQISKLLGRLRKLELISASNGHGSKRRTKSWFLTQRGRELVSVIAETPSA